MVEQHKNIFDDEQQTVYTVNNLPMISKFDFSKIST